MTNPGSSAEAKRHPYAAARAIELQDKGDLWGAQNIYRSLLQKNPRDVDALCGLAGVLWQAERYEEAIPHLRRALNQRPNSATAHTLLAITLYSMGRQEEACERARRAIACDPQFAEAHNALAQAMSAMGSYAEAISVQERAIELAPNQPRYYFGLGAMQSWNSDSPKFKALQALAEKSGSLAPTEQVYLHFALGKAWHDCGDMERAFRHQLKGAALKRRSLTYSEAATLGDLENLSRVVDRDWLRQREGAGNTSDVPIFILGMPRSGSTLVEQILASHPQVRSIGERSFFPSALGQVAGRGANLPARLPNLPKSDLNRIGVLYLDLVRESCGFENRIVDKLPHNFHLVGLIHAALPHARIIHTVRDPVDTCLSIFSILFPGGAQPWSYDLGELGRYYHAYQKIMAHWREVLPPGVMLDVQYEDVVADFEPQVRRIVTHCGLDWDDRCLSFHKLSRPIMTASHAQVRKPIYRSSVGRMRPPPELLQPLLDALGVDAASHAESG